MVRVEIVRTSNAWYLVIQIEGQIVQMIEHKRLVEALETAALLKLHVDNAVTLPTYHYKRILF